MLIVLAVRVFFIILFTYLLNVVLLPLYLGYIAVVGHIATLIVKRHLIHLIHFFLTMLVVRLFFSLGIPFLLILMMLLMLLLHHLELLLIVVQLLLVYI
jgi:hypothetical protein